MAADAPTGVAFELKGRMAPFTVLEVLTAQVDAVLGQLDARLAQAPDFFAGMPLVVAPAEAVSLDGAGLEALVTGLRERALLPVAAAGLSAETAATAGLGLIRNLEAPRAAGNRARRRDNDATAAAGAARVVTQPVRSGQQVYARGGDLVVTAPVSAGAELMADGHVHVYDTLRGRALAGVQGDENARIFCRSLKAELIAIAGHYRLSDQIDAGLRDAPAMAWLRDGELEINAL
jgi:septum site-determining protein MinC